MRVHRLSVLILPGVLAGVLPAAGQEPAGRSRWPAPNRGAPLRLIH
jgi:hypothetical protein